ncbi:MAG: hypothetical protein ACOCWS_06765 [Alkalispirochaetaceae bacterium]
MSQDLSHILRQWPYDPRETIRLITADDGREVLQLRLPLGLEQYELTGRPDGLRPMDEESYLHHLEGQAARYVETHAIPSITSVSAGSSSATARTRRIATPCSSSAPISCG